jgi:hypothetical protein
MTETKETSAAAGNERLQPSLRSLLQQRYLRRELRQATLTSPAIVSEQITRRGVSTPASGWVAYASWSNQTGKPITNFESTWIVPNGPLTKSGQIIFLFNSLEIPNAHILQPVLSWGTISDVPSSGEFWTVASWWVGKESEPFNLSELVRVNPGEKLTGRITMYRQANSLCDYTCEFLGRAATKMTIGNLPELTDCTETLEVYYIHGDSDYPDTNRTSFTGINLSIGGQPAQFTWTPLGNYPPKLAGVPEGSEVQIVYPHARPSA